MIDLNELNGKIIVVLFKKFGNKDKCI